MPSLVSKQYDDYVWELKYRPDSMAKVVLPAAMRNQFESIIENGNLPNMLFSGGPGIGKTTVAFVLADVMGLDAMYMNMSLETSVEAVRTKLTGYTNSVSLAGNKKVLIGDEFDRLSPQAMDSLKGVIEKSSKNCKFIFTSNHKTKIIEPIISRLQEVDFVYTKKELPELKKQAWQVACTILQKEMCVFDKGAVAAVVKKLFPDMRKILNHLQMLSLRGEINMDAVSRNDGADTAPFFKMIADKDWTSVRQYIADLPVAYNDFYSILYNDYEKYVAPASRSEAIVLLAKYQYEAAFAVDKQIPLAAMAIELMELEYMIND